MRLTTHTDYGLRLLLFLASAPDEVATVSEIAEAYGISRNHLVKVAGDLARHGHVETLRGRGGGVRLARTPAQIIVGQVVRELEPDFELVECFNTELDQCAITRACSLKGPLYAAQAAFLASLDKYTLEDLMTPRAVRTQLAKIRVGATPG